MLRTISAFLKTSSYISKTTSRFDIHKWPVNVVFCVSLVVALASTSCTELDPEDENGTIGTGIYLDGSVGNTLLASGSAVDVLSADGKRSRIPINSSGEFTTDTLSGTGPWMLRVQASADRALFGIAYGNETSNINAFSDVSLRRWFAQRSLRIDDIFETPTNLVQRPTSTEYDVSLSSIFQLIEPVLASYEVSRSDIISTRYNNNDQGVDKFLKLNTVVIQDNSISFQVTNPANGFQTEIVSESELSGDSIDNGTAPTTPGSVRALSGGMDDIVLIWAPSSDDTGVLGYEVYRDSVLLGSTPYPQFIDTQLTGNQTYSYVVVAFDGAGNLSNSSVPVTGDASQTTTDNPTTPTDLSQIPATSSIIRLSWLPADEAGIAYYNVYRGPQDPQDPSLTIYTPLQRVSVPRAVDTTVAVNQTYCYQVEAVTATGLESSRSEALCIQAGNSGLTDDEASGPGGLPDDRWLVPDVSTLSCSELGTQDIPFGLTTLNEGCYSVPQTLTVRDGATLQLGGGVVLKFGEAAKLYVEGTLTVLGTVDNPVVFTGMIKVKGSWGGVEFAGTRNPSNYLRGAVIEYGGGADVNGAVSAVHGLSSGPRFQMEDTLIRHTDGPALYLSVANTRIDSFEGNLIYANVSIGSVAASTVHTFAGSSEYIENSINEIFVNPSTFENTDIVIPNLNIPIVWGGLTIKSGSLTILPGADLKILGGNFIVDVDGPVTIVGDAERPITLRGRQTGSQGTWNGLRLHGAGTKRLNHVNISYGGASDPETGAIEIDCTGNNRFHVQIDNTEITYSASWGIFVKGDRCTTNIGNTVTYWENALGNSNVP